MFAHVVVANAEEGLSEDFEPVVGLGVVGGVVFVVDLASFDVGEESLTVEEVAVLDVEVQVAQGEAQQS